MNKQMRNSKRGRGQKENKEKERKVEEMMTEE